MWNDSFENSNIDETDWDKIFRRWSPEEEIEDPSETSLFLLNTVKDDDDDKTTNTRTTSSTSTSVSFNEFRQISPSPTKTTLSTSSNSENRISTKYLDELKMEKCTLVSLVDPPPFKHLAKILDNEIERVESALYPRVSSTTIPSDPDIDLDLGLKLMDLVFDDSPVSLYRNFGDEPMSGIGGSSGRFIRSGIEWRWNRVEGLFEAPTNPNREYRYKQKIAVPKNPEYNFVGRLIGPRGNTIKRMEADTGCRLLVRGKGSMKDEAKEQYLLTQKYGYEHLAEDLHILVQADDVNDLKRGVAAVEAMMIPVFGNDELKKRQLRELAIINGNCRPPRHFDDKEKAEETKD